LVYWRQDASFFHYDSLGMNTDCAQSLAQKLAPTLTRSTARCQLQKGCMPRQTNGSDCGVYVLAAAEMLCQALHQGGGRDEFHRVLQEQLRPETAVQLRSKYLKVIEDKSAAQ
jgi:Ulp1 family protease